MKEIKIDVQFDLGQIVYQKTVNSESYCGIVTGCVVREGGRPVYLVTWPDDGEKGHFGFELAAEAPVHDES